MNGEMVFAQFGLQEMMREFRKLELSELGLLMRIVLENCLMQGPLERDIAALPRLLGCKTNKTLLRQIDELKKKGVVRETEEGLIANIAEIAIEHFQRNSKNGTRAVNARKDRQKSYYASEKQQSDTLMAQGTVSENPTSFLDHPHPANKKGESVTLPIDQLIENLKSLAERAGRRNLADALREFKEKSLVETWLALPLPPEKIIEKIAKVLNIKTTKSSERISSWKYFDVAIKKMANADGPPFQ